jgi:hypothetical protein
MVDAAVRDPAATRSLALPPPWLPCLVVALIEDQEMCTEFKKRPNVLRNRESGGTHGRSWHVSPVAPAAMG